MQIAKKEPAVVRRIESLQGSVPKSRPPDIEGSTIRRSLQGEITFIIYNLIKLLSDFSTQIEHINRYLNNLLARPNLIIDDSMQFANSHITFCKKNVVFKDTTLLGGIYNQVGLGKVKSERGAAAMIL